jgi:bile acid:Na+ symporter, BASS family
MKQAQKYILFFSFISAAFLLLLLMIGWGSFASALAVLTVITFAIGIGSVSSLKSYQYTAWIIVAIVCGIIYPTAFLKWGSFDLRNKWVILIVVQIVMFGMGTQMSIKDFTNVKTMGKGVLVGILCQFSIMPLVGYLLTRIFNFEPEIAAGIILIGSCSSGLASNVMVYIARANLPLSVTLTAVATLLAPVMTPFMMKMLAGTYVQVNFMDMCVQIIKIVIVPIGAAMLYDVYKLALHAWIKRINIAFTFSVVWLIAQIFGFWKFLDTNLSGSSMMVVELLSFLAGAVIVGKLYYHATVLYPKIRGFMPKLSMFGIVYFTVVTTAASRGNILTIGLLILIASILHNTLGYTFGYWISRALKLDKNSCRTIALEVGLQNGGMASGLAGVMGKLSTLGLAAAVFSPWMNISGSMLANYWRRKNGTGNNI